MIFILSYQIMMEVTKTLATDTYEVIRDGETAMVRIVPQMVSSLRFELTFGEDRAGYFVKSW